MGQTREEILEEARKRRERILTYMTQDPPVPLGVIRMMEGMHDRACRQIIKELDAEHNLGYMQNHSRVKKDAIPYGITSSTDRFRQKLGDHLYSFRERWNDSSTFGRNEVAPRVGLNNRQQIRAENRPFTHDWTLSQIERLARELGEDPREFMLKCLTT